MGSNSKLLKIRIIRIFVPMLVCWMLINVLVVLALHQTLIAPGFAEQETIFDFSPMTLVSYVMLWGAGTIGILYSAYLTYRHLTTQEEVQNELRESEERFRQLVEVSPNVIAVHQDGVLVFINQAGLLLFGAKNESGLLGKAMLDFVHPESRETVVQRIAEMTKTGQPAPRVEEKFVVLDGSVIEVGITSAPLEFRGKLAFQMIIEDISIRKRLERAMHSIEAGISTSTGQGFFESTAAQLAKALESEVVFIGEYLPASKSVRTVSVFKDGKIISNFEYSLRGTPCENVVYKEFCCYPSGVAMQFPDDKALKENGIEGYLGIPLWDSKQNPTGIIVALYRRPITAPDFARGLVQIFASRVQAEMERARAMNALVESEARLEAAFNNIPFEIWLSDANGSCMMQNPISKQYWGNMEGKLPNDLGFPAEIQAAWADRNRRVLAGEVAHDPQVIQKDGKTFHFDTILAPIHVGERITGMVGVNIDVTEHVLSEAKIRSHVERLSALRNIDQVILGGSDIRMVMDGICKHVSVLLHVDAVEILQYDAATITFEILARKGVESYSVFNHFPVYGDIAAQAVVQQKVIFESDFAGFIKSFPSCAAIENENFSTYIAVPLIAKGVVRGVLEVFHRSDLKPDDEWWELAHTLANQAAIAIDNLSLFQDLQRSNADLSLAYDLTLEGWSKALEIRDQETQGHAQRVTALTIRLTEALGVPRNQMVHIRRGALLHDIGKMGIPDKILHKPGPLTEEEWLVVRKHPQTAFELLLPIPFLHHALDIPYCHHERWDGSGYPRGLKGEEIPLAARIFSVVDVWDALTSNRPYRAAESPERVSQYLREKSGLHFDPEIVDMFEKFVLKRSCSPF